MIMYLALPDHLPDYKYNAREEHLPYTDDIQWISHEHVY